MRRFTRSMVALVIGSAIVITPSAEAKRPGLTPSVTFDTNQPVGGSPSKITATGTYIVPSGWTFDYIVMRAVGSNMQVFTSPIATANNGAWVAQITPVGPANNPYGVTAEITCHPTGGGAQQTFTSATAANINTQP
jgi:hypothetical protein